MTQETNGIVQTIMSLGEERMGEVVNQLLANEAFVTAIQATITSSLSAKHNVDKRVLGLLSSLNVPSVEDLDAVSGKLDELEDLLAEVEDRLHRVRDKVERKGKAAESDEAKKPARKKAAKKTSTAKKKPATDS